MRNNPTIKDIWIIHYSVPNKDKNELLRPFIVVNIINDQIYGIPLTSFQEGRYKQKFGDFIFENQFLDVKSIIKPYQIIKIKYDYFKNKIGTVDEKIINRINQSINSNIINYLSMKNVSSIIREYFIEKQNQKISLLELENQNLKRELELFKKSKELQENEFELEID